MCRTSTQVTDGLEKDAVFSAVLQCEPSASGFGDCEMSSLTKVPFEVLPHSGSMHRACSCTDQIEFYERMRRSPILHVA